MARHFLYLTNSQMVSLVSRGGAFEDRREFEVNEAGVAAFDERAKALASLPVHLITDLAEEDFRPDTIPHTGGRDRDAIVTRKLGQIYRNTPYRYALILGREAEGRRDDRVIYAAITNAEALRPWLDALERHRVPLVGIHSAAILTTRLAEALALPAEHLLLVVFTPGETLRQTYFRRGELRFTRLTPVDLEEGRTVGTLLAEETTRTWQYLDNLRSFAVTDRLIVAIVAHPRDHAEIRPALQGFQQLGYELADSAALAARIGLKPAPATSNAEEILLQLFRRKPVENHFASAELRRDWTLRNVRNAVAAVSAVILVAGLAVGGMNLAQILRTGEDDQQTARQVAETNREYERIASELPTGGVAASSMRDTVRFYTAFIEPYPTITGFMAPLSAALEKHPGVRLTQLAWQPADDAKAMPAMVVQPARVPPPVKAVAKGGDVAARPPPSDENASPPLSGGRYEVALIEASVNVPSHDFRSALAEVDRLVEDIGRVPGFRADIVESPLDIRPSLQLQGRNVEREADSMESRFVLRVVRTRAGGA
jgi:hypothetical protein